MRKPEGCRDLAPSGFRTCPGTVLAHHNRTGRAGGLPAQGSGQQRPVAQPDPVRVAEQQGGLLTGQRLGDEGLQQVPLVAAPLTGETAALAPRGHGRHLLTAASRSAVQAAEQDATIRHRAH